MQQQFEKIKTRILNILFVAGVVISFTACKKVLDLKPLDSVTDLTLWSNQEMVVSYSGNFYAQLTSGFTTDWLIGSITDDGAVPNSSSGARTYSNPTFTSSNSIPSVVRSPFNS